MLIYFPDNNKGKKPQQKQQKAQPAAQKAATQAKPEQKKPSPQTAAKNNKNKDNKNKGQKEARMAMKAKPAPAGNEFLTPVIIVGVVAAAIVLGYTVLVGV